MCFYLIKNYFIKLPNYRLLFSLRERVTPFTVIIFNLCGEINRCKFMLISLKKFQKIRHLPPQSQTVSNSSVAGDAFASEPLQQKQLERTCVLSSLNVKFSFAFSRIPGRARLDLYDTPAKRSFWLRLLLLFFEPMAELMFFFWSFLLRCD